MLIDSAINLHFKICERLGKIVQLFIIDMLKARIFDVEKVNNRAHFHLLRSLAVGFSISSHFLFFFNELFANLFLGDCHYIFGGNLFLIFYKLPWRSTFLILLQDELI